MSDNTKSVIDLAQEAMVRSIAKKTDHYHTEETTDILTICKNDKECTQRWISAFSDCD